MPDSGVFELVEDSTITEGEVFLETEKPIDYKPEAIKEEHYKKREAEELEKRQKEITQNVEKFKIVGLKKGLRSEKVVLVPVEYINEFEKLNIPLQVTKYRYVICKLEELKGKLPVFYEKLLIENGKLMPKKMAELMWKVTKNERYEVEVARDDVATIQILNAHCIKRPTIC